MRTKYNRLQVVREQKRRSREWLADTAGVCYEYVRRLESPWPPSPSLRIAWRLGKALGTRVETLFPVETSLPKAS